MIRKIHIICGVLTIFFFVANVSYAQNERGVLNIRNYSPQEYGAHAQNLCIIQDKRGIMYFGNNRGVLQYDGSFWELIKVENETSVSALGVDSLGRVYVGALGDLGYLKPGIDGKLLYHSLVAELPESVKDFDRVIRIFCNEEGVYFMTRKYIIRWNGTEFKAWGTDTQFHTSFLVDDVLYISIKEKGIFSLKNDQLTLLPGTEIFANLSIYDISMFRGNFVITTSDQGIYLFSGSSLKKVTGDITNVYNGINVYNTYYALGLFGDGLMVLNKDFHKEYVIDLRNGLAEGTVNAMYVDRENNLWLALGRGIAKVELISPITVHKFDTGLKGTVQDVIRYKGTIYASTSNGVFYYDETGDEFSKFHQIPNLTIDCYGMNTFITDRDTLLMVSGVDGIYVIEKGKNPNRIFPCYPWIAKQSKINPNRLIIAEDVTLTSILYQNGKWELERNVDQISQSVFNFVETKEGDLWLGTMGSGVIHTTKEVFTNNNAAIEFYDTLAGLPDGPVFITQLNSGGVLFGTSSGIEEFNEQTKRFELSKKYKLPNHKGVTGVHRISMDNKGQLWLSCFYEDNSYDIMYYTQNAWYKTPFLRYNSEIVQCFYHEKSGVTWLGSASGLIRYDQNFRKDYESPFSVCIRKVVAHNKPVFEGAFVNADSVLIDNQPADEEMLLTFDQNSVTFEFSALTFFDESGTKFSFMLQGLNEEWSEWNHSPKAIFTNIHEGSYEFRVKARNIYGVESEEAVYRFKVLPPWYRTMWAYLAYFVFFVGFVWGAISISTRSLKRIIQERTAEIVQQKEEIEKQKEIVEEKNKDILDSIKYAKRIQDAILPGEDAMKEVLGRDLFVLYKPKDIVSGDFYWMRVKNNKVLYSAVDCTGHGVPGAFVSIVGNNGLNRAVNEFNLIQPAAILDNLAVTVEDAFHTASHSDVRDGMDISLCSLEMTGFNKAVLNWAGANNPLWIVKAENPTEVFEVKADKQPIGKYENRKPYTNHEFELVKGDTVYVFTDGYADQFGGPAGKKFKYSQLKEILLGMSHLSMSEQRELLNQKFEDWKASLEQIDDVCIIGVRI